MPEKEVRLIDANALQRKICGAKCGCEYEDCGNEGDCEFDFFIFHAPTIDPESLRPHGKWETDKEDIEWGNHLKKKHCTNCSSRPHYDKEKGVFILTAYCPNCGAKMEE